MKVTGGRLWRSPWLWPCSSELCCSHQSSVDSVSVCSKVCVSHSGIKLGGSITSCSFSQTLENIKLGWYLVKCEVSEEFLSARQFFTRRGWILEMMIISQPMSVGSLGEDALMKYEETSDLMFEMLLIFYNLNVLLVQDHESHCWFDCFTREDMSEMNSERRQFHASPPVALTSLRLEHVSSP